MSHASAEHIVAEIDKDFPCRRSQTRQLIGCLVHGGVHLVRGPTSTGKTSILRALPSRLEIPCAFVSLASEHTPLKLIEAILTQLGVPLPEKIEASGPGPGRAAKRPKISRASTPAPADEPADGTDPAAPAKDPDAAAAALDVEDDDHVSRIRAKSLYTSACLSALTAALARPPPPADAPTPPPPANAKGKGKDKDKDKGKAAAAAAPRPGPPHMVRRVIVVDDLDLLGMLGEGRGKMEDMLQALVLLLSDRIPPAARPHTALILVASGVPTASDTLLRMVPSLPSVIAFPQYSTDELGLLLMRDAADRPGYVAAVNFTLQSLQRQTESLKLLRRYAHDAYEAARAQAKGGNVKDNDALYALNVKKHLATIKAEYGKPDIRYHSLGAPATAEAEAGPSNAGAGPRAGAAARASEKTGIAGAIAAAEGVNLSGIPTMGRFLLLAGYIASRNEKSLDADLFNIGANAFKRYRRTIKGVATADVLDARRREAYNKAPSLFTVERLLAIYWRMYENEGLKQEDLPVDEAEMLKETMRERRLALSCTIMNELATLEKTRLLARVEDGGVAGMLRGSSELRCNLPEAAAEQLAKSVNVKLSQYVIFTN